MRTNHTHRRPSPAPRLRWRLGAWRLPPNLIACSAPVYSRCEKRGSVSRSTREWGKNRWWGKWAERSERMKGIIIIKLINTHSGERKGFPLPKRTNIIALFLASTSLANGISVGCSLSCGVCCVGLQWGTARCALVTSAFLYLAGGSDQPWKIMPQTHACKCGKQSGDKQTSMTAVFSDKKTKNKKEEEKKAFPPWHQTPPAKKEGVEECSLQPWLLYHSFFCTHLMNSKNRREGKKLFPLIQQRGVEQKIRRAAQTKRKERRGLMSRREGFFFSSPFVFLCLFA